MYYKNINSKVFNRYSILCFRGLVHLKESYKRSSLNGLRDGTPGRNK